jgi:hypothetical protein
MRAQRDIYFVSTSDENMDEIDEMPLSAADASCRTDLQDPHAPLPKILG